MARITDKILFIHIPKTGGVWVRKAMTNAGLSHKMPRGVRNKKEKGLWLGKSHSNLDQINPEDIEGKFKFTFVRHPLSWYRSYFCFRKYDYPPISRENANDELVRDNFKDYLDTSLGKYPNGWVSTLYKNFIGENADKVDFIGKQENLVEDLIEALRLSGEEFNEDVIRKTPVENTSYAHIKDKSEFDISRELEERVLQAESWVINKFYQND